VEAWADEAAADGHMKTPHVVAGLAAITPMFSEPPDIVRFEKLL
jgi:quinol monooxygenase YgiN